MSTPNPFPNPNILNGLSPQFNGLAKTVSNAPFVSPQGGQLGSISLNFGEATFTCQVCGEGFTRANAGLGIGEETLSCKSCMQATFRFMTTEYARSQSQHDDKQFEVFYQVGLKQGSAIHTSWPCNIETGGLGTPLVKLVDGTVVVLPTRTTAGTSSLCEDCPQQLACLSNNGMATTVPRVLTKKDFPPLAPVRREKG